MGQNVTGDVHSHLEETMSVLGVPFLAKKTLSGQSMVLVNGGKKICGSVCLRLEVTFTMGYLQSR